MTNLFTPTIMAIVVITGIAIFWYKTHGLSFGMGRRQN